MGKKRKTVTVYICERCGHDWVPRGKDAPRICPKCKTAYFDIPKRTKPAP